MSYYARAIERSSRLVDAAVDAGTMHTAVVQRDGKRVVLRDGTQATEFMSCSYLGLDTHPRVVEGAAAMLRRFGVHICTARSRISIEPTFELERELSALFGGEAITFPSVSVAHASVLPLLAAGQLFERPRRVTLVIDALAHASMQFLRPVLERHAPIEVVPHNDLERIESLFRTSCERGESAVYLGDSVYSMGGVAPVVELVALAERYDGYLYLDDAHGTSIYGERGEGYVLAKLGQYPSRLFLPFSLAKGFGCNGGGIVLPTSHAARRVRHFGQGYVFSGPLDFSLVGAALEAVALHRDGTVARLQAVLRERVEQFRAAAGLGGSTNPICMIPARDEDHALAWARALLGRGYLVTAAFFPVVPLERPQLRVTVTAAHSPAEVLGLAAALAAPCS